MNKSVYKMSLKCSTNQLHHKRHVFHHKPTELIYYYYNEIHNKLKYKRQFCFLMVINIPHNVVLNYTQLSILALKRNKLHFSHWEKLTFCSWICALTTRYSADGGFWLAISSSVSLNQLNRGSRASWNFPQCKRASWSWAILSAT